MRALAWRLAAVALALWALGFGALALGATAASATSGELTALASPPALAAPRPVSACGTREGVTLVVDFSHWGGPLLRACGSTPTTSYELLNQGGWHTSGTEHDGPGFICRIGYAGFRHGTSYPTLGQQACIDTPPTSAYWTYWVAGPGQDAWHYSQVGAMNFRPAPGSVDLWVFGGTNLSGTSGSAVPTISPDGVRLAAKTAASTPGAIPVVNAPPVAAAAAATHRGSAVPVVITAVIVAMLAAVAFVAVRRRARPERAGP